MPLGLDDIQAWLLELGQHQAAALLDEAVLEYDYIDTTFRMDSGDDYGTEIFELSVRVPARIYRQLTTELKEPAEIVEKAIAELSANIPNSWIRSTCWVLRIPKLSEVQALPLTNDFEGVTDVSDIRRLWGKAKARLISDPEGAITAARTLLESTLGYCIKRNGGTYSNTDDLPALFKKAAANLSIAPNAATADEYKRMVAACATIVNSIAAIRNRESDSHKSSGTAPLWHAQLVVNLSGSIANFLLALPTQTNRNDRETG